ncbi:MAG TPA: ligase-associated DNA damage response exonuclease [Candidatus Kapabacteria bacterium]|nr:ligase-associated DNA damage response exonuclease [Candidatus Kapabacteria bacterium]
MATQQLIPPLIQSTSSGLYCQQGDFYIDPHAPVARAIITHAHTDHARPGMKSYLTSKSGAPLVRLRVGMRAMIETLEFGSQININGVTVSLHPAGHILGSAQVRVEYNGEVWVVSGDYKLEPEPTCETFESVKCHTFITESTFGRPTYKWRPQQEIFNRINDWWSLNKLWGNASVINAYSLGKAQRLLAGVDKAIGPVYIYHTIEDYLPHYRKAGVVFPEMKVLSAESMNQIIEETPLIVAPPNMKIFDGIDSSKLSTGFASGWMSRGGKNSTVYDIGFPLSDHADWDGLLTAIKQTEATRVFVMHGFTKTLATHLCEIGYDAHELVFPPSATGRSW